MFTGIIEEIGEVVSCGIAQGIELWDGSIGEGYVLVVKCVTVLKGATLGCSIAVNGTCLTVVSFDETAGTFTVNLAPETISRTNLGDLKPAGKVNLERAASTSGDAARNSGHYVQGHVDGTASIVSFRKDNDSLWVTLEVPADILKMIVEKGFIAVDGVSLTVCEVDHAKSTFNLMLVPHTQTHITLPLKKLGDKVNLEVDVLAKYVEASVSARLQRLESAVFGDESKPAAKPTEEGNAPAAAAKAAATTDGNPDGEMRAIEAQLRTVHGAGLNTPLPQGKVASSLKIAVIRTSWHEGLIAKLETKCIAALKDGGVLAQNIHRIQCPGSFELPYAAHRAAVQSTSYDAIVCIGILLKGGTIHMEVIANGVTSNILDVQMKTGVPIIFGVLTVLAIEQAEERADSDLGYSWGQSALTMAMVKKDFTKCIQPCP